MFNKIIVKYIDNEKTREFRKYDLSAIQKIFTLIGSPHLRVKTVHIAGTNGKGTTANLLNSLLTNSGIKTGLFTSPHLIHYNERIKINSNNISDAELDKYASYIDKVITENCITATFFDILTAMALKYFHDKNVEIAIIETGLGGRLDSTNIISPELSIITKISRDHTNILGNTVDEIVSEKCGIIKKFIPVITNNRDERILSKIASVSTEKSAPLSWEGRDYSYTLQDINQHGMSFTYDHQKLGLELKTYLVQRHQLQNVSLSITAYLMLLKQLKITPDMDIIESTVRCFNIKGRFQKTNDQPLVYYDVAHNFDSLNALFNTVDELFSSHKVIFIISLLKDKVTDEIKKLLTHRKKNIIYLMSDEDKCYKPDSGLFEVYTDKNELFCFLSKECSEKSIFIFTGTFRLYEIMNGIIRKLNYDK